MIEYFVLDGRNARPVGSLEEWARSFELADRHVAVTQIGDVSISTVFLGVNHNFGDGPPLIFETMIFGGPHDQYQERCSTWDEAEAQHANAVALVRRDFN